MKDAEQIMKNRKKVTLILATVIAGFAAIAAAAYFFILPSISAYPAINLSVLTPDQKRTLDSLEKIDDHPLYKMNYYGDYSQFLLLKDKYYRQLGLPEPKCSTFSALSPGSDAILGYNSDSDKTSYLLLFAHPTGGYASVSVVHIGEAFGFGTTSNTPLDSEQKRALLLYSPFFTNNTGMNEMGFAYAVMAAPGSEASISHEKPSMNNGEIQRYLLDHAKDMADAIDILQKNNVCFSSDPNHWLLADASGHSAVVEWVNGKMQVLRNNEAWQVSTNFQLTGSQDKIDSLMNKFHQNGKISGDVNGLSYWRYATAWDALKKTHGNVDKLMAMDILQSISLTKSKDVWFATQYSVVYNLKSREFQIVLDKQYGKGMTFSLPGD
jgi:hypothetical protein